MFSPVTAHATPKALTLLIVRHGITAWNAAGRLQGQSDIPLAPEGKSQAKALGRRLATAWSDTSLPTFPGPPVAVYTSDLSRARETAEIIIRENPRLPHPPHITPSLRERGFGEWEGLTADEARSRFGEGRSYRREGEPHETVHDRMRTALARIWRETIDPIPDSTAPSPVAAMPPVAMIVGHGGSLRQLVCVVCGLELSAARLFHLDNTGLCLLEMEGATLDSATGSIRLWNDTAHLSPAFRPDGNDEAPAP